MVVVSVGCLAEGIRVAARGQEGCGRLAGVGHSKSLSEHQLSSLEKARDTGTLLIRPLITPCNLKPAQLLRVAPLLLPSTKQLVSRGSNLGQERRHCTPFCSSLVSSAS